MPKRFIFTAGLTLSLALGVFPMTPAIATTSNWPAPAISFSAGTSGHVVISGVWTAPVLPTGKTLLGYTLSAVGPTQTLTCTTTSATTCGISGNLGQTYVMSVIARLSGTTATTINSLTTTAALLAPSQISGVATSPSSGAILVSWAAPTVPVGAPPITSVTATASVGSTSVAGTCSVNLPNTNNCTISGLTNLTTYQISVRASNLAGASTASPAIPATPFMLVPLSAVSAVNGGNSSILVRWNAASGNPSGTFSYRAIATDTTQGSVGTQSVCTPTGTATSCAITALTPGHSYSVQVVASYNGASMSPVTFTNGTNNVVLVFNASAAPVVTAQVGSSAGSGSVILSWSPPTVTNGSDLTGYAVNYADITIGGAPQFVPAAACTNLSSSARSCVVNGLVNGDNYTFQVTAFNGLSATSTITGVVPYGPPTAPLNVRAVVSDSGKVNVNWSPPSGLGGGSLFQFIATASSSSGQPLSCTTTSTSCQISGLTNGVAYSIVVRVVTGPDTISGFSTSSTPISITPISQTGTVNNLQIVVGPSAGDGNLVVSWSAPNASGTSQAATPLATSYTVTLTDQTVSSPVLSCIVLAGNPLQCSFSNLIDGHSYQASVTAFNGLTSSAVNGVAEPYGPPGQITAPSVSAGFSNSSDGSLLVSWVPVASNGSPVTYTATATDTNPNGTPQTATCTVSATSATSCIIRGLTDGDSYSVSVSAQNSFSTTSASSSGTTKVFGPPSNATGITTLVGPLYGSGVVVVNWTAPSQTFGNPLTGYVVEALLASDGTTIAGSCPSSQSGPSSNSCQISGLSDGVAYTILVLAYNGQNTYSTSASVAASPYTAPTPVQNLSATVGPAAGSGTAVITWTAPANSGGRAISTYDLQCFSNNVLIGSYPGLSFSTNSYTINNLTNGTMYSCKIRANNLPGASSTWATSSSFTPFGAPSAPTNLSVVNGSSVGSQSLLVSWSAPSNTNGKSLTGYVVGATTGLTGSPVSTCQVSAAQTSCTIQGLTNGTPYFITVTAFNAPSSSSSLQSQSTFNPYTAPAAVTGVSGSVGQIAGGSGTIAVSWQPPSDNGGNPIVSYTATALSGGIVKGTCTASNPNATGCSITGLTNGSSYTVSVVVSNGPGSNSGQQISPASYVPYGPPSVVQNVRWMCVPAIASPSICQSGELIAVWTAPAQNNGQNITGYVLTLVDQTNQMSAVTFHATAAQLTYDFLSLQNGHQYVLQVAAQNDNASQPSIGIAGVSSPQSPFTIPAALSLTQGNVQTGAAGSLAISWTPGDSGGSPIIYYRAVTVSVNGASSGPGVGMYCSVPGTSTSCTISNLENGASYQVAVYAANAQGLSAISNLVAGTPNGPPSGGDLLVTPGPQQLSTILENLNLGQISIYNVAWSYAVCPDTSTCDPTSQSWPPTFMAIPSSTCTQAFTSLSTVPQCQISSGLTNGTNYLMKAVVSNSYGSLVVYASAPVMPTGFPGQPGNVAATLTYSSATVTWAAPIDNGGSPIIQYSVSSTPNLGQPCIFLSSTGGPLQCQLSGLTFGVSYTFYVTAYNAAGPGAAGLSPVYLVGSASPPSGVQAVPINAGIIVSWTPSTANGFPISSYTATATGGGSSYTCTTGGSTAPSASCVIIVPNCVNNGSACPTYSISVTASNVIGTTTTTSSPAIGQNTVTVFGVPGVPTAVSAVALATKLQVSWQPPVNPGSGITMFVVTAASQVAANGNFFCTIVPPFPSGGPLSCAVTGLQLGQTFNISVQAFDSVGGSASSTVLPATTSNLPVQVQNLTVVPQSNSFVAMWTPYPATGANSPTSYRVTASLSGVTCSNYTIQSTGVYASICSPPSGTTLTATSSSTFSVVAVNATGLSPAAVSAPASPQSSLAPSITGSAPSLLAWQASGGPVLPVAGGIAYAPNGTMFTVSQNPSEVLVTTPGANGLTTQLQMSISLPTPGAIAVSPDGTKVFVADANSGVILVTPTSGGVSQILNISGLTTPLGSIGGLNIIGGLLYISDASNSRIVSVPIAGGSAAVISSSLRLNGNQGIAALPNGDLLIANTQASSLIDLNPTTGLASIVPVYDPILTSQFIKPVSVAVSPDGGTYFVTLLGANGKGTIVEMSSKGGNFGVVASGVTGLGSITMSPSGQLAFSSVSGVSIQLYRLR